MLQVFHLPSICFVILRAISHEEAMNERADRTHSSAFIHVGKAYKLLRVLGVEVLVEISSPDRVHIMLIS
jgi:hypothetical protein